MFTSLKRIIRWGWANFRRQMGISFATCFILVITASTVTALFLFQKGTDFLINSLQEKMDLSIYFLDEATEEEILKIKEELSRLSYIKKVEFVSKAKALEKFVQRHQENPILMESLTEVGGNPFLASLNIKATDLLQYGDILNFLDSGSYKNLVAKIDYYQKKPILEKISDLTSKVNKAALILSGVLGVLACLIVFNQVKMATFYAKQEIEIMRLVGAPNWLIRGPFLVQSLIAGIISVLITFSIFSLTIYFISSRVEIITGGFTLSEHFFENIFFIVLIQILAGIGLPTLLSFVAIRKYLRV